MGRQTLTTKSNAVSKRHWLARNLAITFVFSLSLFCLWAYSQQTNPSGEQALQDGTIPAAQLLQPADLVQILGATSGERPLILQVGSHVLFSEAHIRGSEYVGATGQEPGLQALRERVRDLPRDQFLVIYCGCCPWDKCPNIRAAYREFNSMGFTHLRVLYIQTNLGTNWVTPGYPTDKGD
jgi:thiosulfate/3-mercaptopyruvate sulfurtransferase